MKLIDIELERARRALDGPEAYPGKLIEAVIYGLQHDVAAADYETAKGRAELRVLCERIIARIDQMTPGDTLRRELAACRAD